MPNLRSVISQALLRKAQASMLTGRVTSYGAKGGVDITRSATLHRTFVSSSAFCSLPPLPSQASPLLSRTFSTQKLPVDYRASSSSPVRMSVDGTGSNAGTQALFLKDAAELISGVETFIFDCDGVIWNADVLLEHVKETIDLLRSLGKRLYFLTNNSTKSRKMCVKKAKALGLDVHEDEIFSSGYAATVYLKSLNFPAHQKVYMIGEPGLQEEFDHAGISYIGGSDHDGKEADLTPGAIMEHDRDVGAVVVAFDRSINYYKMQYAALCLRENPGCHFIATNCDEVILITGVQGWPGEAAMVGAIKGSTNKEPVVVGKPSTFMMEYLVNRFNINRERICMVGDNLETDILFGKNCGCKTLLVLTGVTDVTSLQKSRIQPDYYTHQLSDLLSAAKPPRLHET